MQPAQRVGGGSERRKKVWTLSSSKYFSRRKREAESRDFGALVCSYPTGSGY